MEKKWVSVWGNAVSRPVENPERYAKDLTLRYVITPTVDGERVSLTFSNFEGYEPVVIGCVTVARTDPSVTRDVCRDSIRPVTFGGMRNVQLQPGEIRESDPVDFAVVRGEKLSVSFYLDDYTEMGTGVSSSGPLSIGFFARGRYADRLSLPLEESKPTNIYYFLNTVNVLTDAQNHAVMAFGDSITQQSWPEHLTNRLLREGIENVTVVRRAIGGGRVLREYTHTEDAHYGRRGIDRFERELLLTKGVSSVIVLHGINDLIHPEEGHPFRPHADLPSAEELIGGLRTYIRIAKKHGVRIYLATITPFGRWYSYTDEKEGIRQQVNAWIRTNTEADGYVDFADVTKDPADPKSALPEYNSGDGLHPSLTGAFHMAEAVPVEYL